MSSILTLKTRRDVTIASSRRSLSRHRAIKDPIMSSDSCERSSGTDILLYLIYHQFGTLGVVFLPLRWGN